MKRVQINCFLKSAKLHYKSYIFVLLFSVFFCQSIFTQSITLESVDGLIGNNYLKTNQLITFNLRVTAGDIASKSISNGFRVYSNDGATWNTTIGDTTGTLSESYFDLIFAINQFSFDGTGADTIGFNGVALFAGGLPATFDEVSYSITIGPISASDAGKTICLDSSFYFPISTWKWIALDGSTVFPSWDGPHCFSIEDCGLDSVDTDNDGVFDGCDICNGFDDNIDTDSDGIPDGCDVCPNDSQNDIDGDSVCGDIDNCPTDFNTNQNDTDGDGIGDVCDICLLDSENDLDIDGICGESDNCRETYNPNQLDSDSDGIGDVCDVCNGYDDTIDIDSDGVPDGCDICQGADDNVDSDSDGVPDGCDICLGFNDNTDSDSDGIPNGCDNCPNVYNLNQNDIDNDSVGNSCDNCITEYNPDQMDSDNNGIGDVCDSVATDIENQNNFPNIPKEFDISQNYPNPFNPQTVVEYSIPQHTKVLIEVINVKGQIIRTLVNSSVGAGVYQIVWDGNNSLGQKVSSGIYLYRFQAGDYVKTKKMLMLK